MQTSISEMDADSSTRIEIHSTDPVLTIAEKVYIEPRMRGSLPEISVSSDAPASSRLNELAAPASDDSLLRKIEKSDGTGLERRKWRCIYTRDY